jgi:hypothetical protein
MIAVLLIIGIGVFFYVDSKKKSTQIKSIQAELDNMNMSYLGQEKRDISLTDTKQDIEEKKEAVSSIQQDKIDKEVNAIQQIQKQLKNSLSHVSSQEQKMEVKNENYDSAFE